MSDRFHRNPKALLGKNCRNALLLGFRLIQDPDERPVRMTFTWSCHFHFYTWPGVLKAGNEVFVRDECLVNRPFIRKLFAWWTGKVLFSRERNHINQHACPRNQKQSSRGSYEQDCQDPLPLFFQIDPLLSVYTGLRRSL